MGAGYMHLLSLTLIFICLASHASAVTVRQFTGCGACRVNNLIWAPGNVTILHTSDNDVFWSGDEGITWVKKLDNIEEVQQFATNPEWIVAVGYQLHVSKDGGANFYSYSLPTQSGGSPNLLLHPHISGRMLYQLCTSYTNCPRNYYTVDDGMNWLDFNASNMYAASWSYDPYTPDLIFGMQPKPGQHNDDFGYTDLSTGNFNTILSHSFGYVYTPHYVWVGIQSAVYGEVNLYASSRVVDRSHTQKENYVESDFPFGDELPVNGYTILDDAAGAGFVAVMHNEYWGNIFSSEHQGRSFVYSLDHAASLWGVYDFDRVAGVRGVYIANQVTNHSAVPPYKRTLISFDNGGEWRPLVAPASSCTGECNLQLHGLTSYFDASVSLPPFYSSPNAIGLIVAVGNIGPYVSADDSKTYLSRDAGVSWVEIYPEATIYEFGDHGGILVWATITGPTDTIWYSLDEGLTKKSYKFTTTTVTVDNIICEYGGTGRRFVLHGYTDEQYVIYGVDFTDEQPRICNDDDYEIFTPSDGQHGALNCLLGETVQYTRRKREAQCYNDRDTDHRGTSTPCECSFEDYECDFGFAPSSRNETDGFTCADKDGNFPPLDPPASCAVGGYYNRTTGYYLVEDNRCVGGLDLTSGEKPCPGTPSHPPTAGPTRLPTPSPTPSPAPTPTPAPTPGGDQKSGGHTIAIVVVVLLAVAVVGGIAFGIYRKPTIVGDCLGIFRKRDIYAPVSTQDDEA